MDEEARIMALSPEEAEAELDMILTLGLDAPREEAQ